MKLSDLKQIIKEEVELALEEILEEEEVVEEVVEEADSLQEKEKPSAGMTKAEKSKLVKRARKGEDIGKKGKGFEKVKKAAEKSGAKDPEAVAAAAMWRQAAKK